MSFPESLKLSDSVSINIVLPEPTRWVIMHYNKTGEPISLLVQENGANDFNRENNEMKLWFRGRTFLVPGDYTFYLYSLNYPVYRVSNNFFIEQAKYRIKIY